ncbi:MAG: helix-turn-helix domain-containing protein [Burkholderiales bacterium]|nr:helix-turn-helix domain-containing protein [Burkholderiales bacterium]
MAAKTVFGSVLREIREELGLSQETLALHCGLDRSFISLLERGRRQPSLTTIMYLAFSLDIAPGSLISKVQEKIPSDFYKNLFRAGAALSNRPNMSA